MGVKIGRGYPRKGNRPRMPKGRKWAEDAQGKKWAEDAQNDEMGQGSLEVMEWINEAQNSMNTSPMVIPNHKN